MLTPVQIKEKFRYRFHEVSFAGSAFRALINKLMLLGDVYIVGGYFRDILNDKNPRDVDVLVDVPQNDLITLLNNEFVNYNLNRYGGAKFTIDQIEIDIWTFENNWAFKNKLVKFDGLDKLNAIARGCFYNYDALVIRLNDYNYSLKYFNDYLKTNQLDILQKNSMYMNLNPSIEANILRAIYIQKTRGSNFSDNLLNYLYKMILRLVSKEFDPSERLNVIKQKYPKYHVVLSDNEVKDFVLSILNKNNTNTLLIL